MTDDIVSRNRLRTILLLIILATIPCYCAGLVSIQLAPKPEQYTPVVVTLTPSRTITPSLTPVAYNTLTPQPSQPTPTPTPTGTAQTATLTLTPTPSLTPLLPSVFTDTPIVLTTDTLTPTTVPPATVTATATATIAPSETPTPTLESTTPAASPTNTATLENNPLLGR